MPPTLGYYRLPKRRRELEIDQKNLFLFGKPIRSQNSTPLKASYCSLRILRPPIVREKTVVLLSPFLPSFLIHCLFCMYLLFLHPSSSSSFHLRFFFSSPSLYECPFRPPLGGFRSPRLKVGQASWNSGNQPSVVVFYSSIRELKGEDNNEMTKKKKKREIK